MAIQKTPEEILETCETAREALLSNELIAATLAQIAQAEALALIAMHIEKMSGCITEYSNGNVLDIRTCSGPTIPSIKQVP